MAQKVIEKEFSAEGLRGLSITDDAIFSIKITSSARKTVKIKLHVSGEHAEAIIIEENRSKGKLSLKTGVMPFFEFEDDKLAAHKVMAIEVSLLVPETIFIELKSRLASLETHGKIENLDISLQKGSCRLYNFLGNAHLRTLDGSIEVQAQSNVTGHAFSKNGTVENTLPKQGVFYVEAESVNGTIYMRQTK